MSSKGNNILMIQRKTSWLTVCYWVSMLCILGVMLEEFLRFGSFHAILSLLVPFGTIGYLLLTKKSDAD